MSTKEERKQLKKEMLEISDRLGPDYINQVTAAFPEFNTPEGRTRIRNVKNAITSDQRIGVILKAIARQREENMEALKKLKI